jgi:hypothetical protein
LGRRNRAGTVIESDSHGGGFGLHDVGGRRQRIESDVANSRRDKSRRIGVGIIGRVAVLEADINGRCVIEGGRNHRAAADNNRVRGQIADRHFVTLVCERDPLAEGVNHLKVGLTGRSLKSISSHFLSPP